MDAHALTIKTVRDGPVCTLILGGDLDLLETGRFLEQAALAVDDLTGLLGSDLASDYRVQPDRPPVSAHPGRRTRATDGMAVRRCRDRNRRRLHEPDLPSPGRQRTLRPARPIQDLGLHLISLYEIGGTEAVPHLPLRASLAHPGASPLCDRGTPYPPMGSRGLATSCPRRRTRNAKASGRVAQPLSGRLWPALFGGS
jgi:hypothetical protein